MLQVKSRYNERHKNKNITISFAESVSTWGQSDYALENFTAPHTQSSVALASLLDSYTALYLKESRGS